MFAMFKLRFPTHNDKILEEKLRNRDGDVCQFFFKYICCCGRSGRVARGAARHSNGSYNSVEHEEGSANSLNVFYKNRRKTEFGI